MLRYKSYKATVSVVTGCIFPKFSSLLTRFCPSVFLYLASVCPSIWLIELDKLESRLEQKERIGDAVGGQFITPIPRPKTTPPLDGAAKNYLFLSTVIHKITHFFVPGTIFLTSQYPRRKMKSHSVRTGIKPRSSCFSSDRTNH